MVVQAPFDWTKHEVGLGTKGALLFPRDGCRHVKNKVFIFLICFSHVLSLFYCFVLYTGPYEKLSVFSEYSEASSAPTAHRYNLRHIQRINKTLKYQSIQNEKQKREVTTVHFTNTFGGKLNIFLNQTTSSYPERPVQTIKRTIFVVAFWDMDSVRFKNVVEVLF